MESPDARSLTDFLRHSREHVERLRATEEPLVLTIMGRPALVVQSAENYAASAARLLYVEGALGLLKARAAETVDLEAGLAGLRAKHGLPS